jgi:hypothetical protein
MHYRPLVRPSRLSHLLHASDLLRRSDLFRLSHLFRLFRPSRLSHLASPAAAVTAFAALLALSTPAHAVGSLADVTIVDRISGQTLPTYHADGQWYVAGRPGARYEIRVRNAAGDTLLAVASVDGVNVVTGETASPAQSGYVLGPGTTLPILGWRKDLARVAAFTFTALDNSYAARTGRPDNVGVIGVAVFRRKPEPPPLARESYGTPFLRRMEPDQGRRSEADAPADAAAPVQKSLGTGHGRIEASTVRYTHFERASDTPDEIVAIRYDSHANLVALGVIPRPPVPYRDPQPFPARFVPDPPARR